jgi:hypothetical protein
VNSKGQLVYTNNIVDNPEPLPRPVSVAPPPSTAVPSSPNPESLQAAVAGLKGGAGAAKALSTPEIGALVNAISLQHGVDPDLVAAVIRAESNYDQWAISPKGARGLMQLMPATAQRFGVLNVFDARDNIQGGVRFLRFLLEKFDGDIELALAGYNAGENLVEKLGKVPPIDETRGYVSKIRAVYTKKTAMLLPLPNVVTPETSSTVLAASTAAPPVPAPPAESPEVKAAPQPTPVQAAPPPEVLPEQPRIYRGVNARGVTSFSNVEPVD